MKKSDIIIDEDRKCPVCHSYDSVSVGKVGDKKFRCKNIHPNRYFRPKHKIARLNQETVALAALLKNVKKVTYEKLELLFKYSNAALCNNVNKAALPKISDLKINEKVDPGKLYNYIISKLELRANFTKKTTEKEKPQYNYPQKKRTEAQQYWDEQNELNAKEMGLNFSIINIRSIPNISLTLLIGNKPINAVKEIGDSSIVKYPLRYQTIINSLSPDIRKYFDYGFTKFILKDSVVKQIRITKLGTKYFDESIKFFNERKGPIIQNNDWKIIQIPTDGKFFLFVMFYPYVKVNLLDKLKK